MVNEPTKAIKVFAWLHPVSVILLLPEIAYSVFFVCWYLTESINHSGLGRTMETHVGLGIIFMILVYGFFVVVGLTTLLFYAWRIYRSIKVSRGILQFSGKDRKSLTFANAIYTIFIVCALLFVNYCDLPGRAKAYSHDASYHCEESIGRKITRALDLFILPYFVSSLFFFSRRKTRKLFTAP